VKGPSLERAATAKLRRFRPFTAADKLGKLNLNCSGPMAVEESIALYTEPY
jgi:hypothetical protein